MAREAPVARLSSYLVSTIKNLAESSFRGLKCEEGPLWVITSASRLEMSALRQKADILTVTTVGLSAADLGCEKAPGMLHPRGPCPVLRVTVVSASPK
jgi:hypothetical protein